MKLQFRIALIAMVGITLNTQAQVEITIKEKSNESSNGDVRIFSHTGTTFGLTMRPYDSSFNGGTYNWNSDFGYKENTKNWFVETNFGIGTTSPTARLDVLGMTKTDNALIIDGVDTGNPSAQPEQLRLSGYGILGNRGAMYITNENPNGHINFRVGGKHGTGTHLLINNNGNVGIGKSNPSEKLEVNGNTRFSDLYIASGNIEQEGSKIYQKFTDNNGSAEASIQFYRNESSKGGGIRSSSEIRFSTTSSSYGADNLGVSTKMVVKGNGNIGVGTASPTEKLHVKGKSQIEHANGRSIKIDGYDGITTSGESHWLHLNRHTNDNVSIANNSTANVFLVKGGGNVGIGTTKPDKQLTLKSNTFLGWEYTGEGSGSHHIITGGGINPMSFTVKPFSANNPIYKFNGYNGTKMTILNGGNVGIGTTKPTAKLAVNGKIHTKEIRVDLNLTDWADFVFYDNYKLPTLTEVENHIKEKGHLKDIPSAKEVAQNGIYLGQMDAKLLQKIEELTLYTIQQEKSLQSQKEEIEDLKQENELLKTLNSKLLEIQKRLDKLESK